MDISADAATGAVAVRGGYRVAPGVWAGRGTFRFRPTREGIAITAPAPPGSVLRVQDFLPAAWTEVLHDARVLRTPTAISRVSEQPSGLELGLTLPSANVTRLQGYRRELLVPAGGAVRWSLTARPLR